MNHNKSLLIVEKGRILAITFPKCDFLGFVILFHFSVCANVFCSCCLWLHWCSFEV